MKTELRLATTQNIPQLLPLVRAYHEFEQIDSSDTLRESALRRLLADPGFASIWMIHANKQLVGYIALCRGFSIEFNGFDAFVDEFYLKPEYRGKGIGKAVLEAIKREARKLEINAIHLEVARDNDRALAFYRAAGFKAREKYLLMSMMLDD